MAWATGEFSLDLRSVFYYQQGATAYERDNMACRLCQKDEPLKKSHIIPKFLWKPLKIEEGKFFAMPSDSSKSEFKMQDGPSERMLCEDCEQQLGRYENYVRQVIYNKPEERDYGFRISGGATEIKITGLDYTRFKLFQLSILWRAHASQNHFFRNVRLGPHAEPIRKMLLEERPGNPADYGCFVLGVLENPGKLLDQAIIQPEQVRLGNHRCYQFVMGGFFWYYVVSNHIGELPFKDRFLGHSGELIIPFRNWKDVELFGKFAEGHRKRQNNKPGRHTP